jgi:hypothetical protein
VSNSPGSFHALSFRELSFEEIRACSPGPPAEDHLQREALQREHLLGELVTKRLGKHDYFTTVIVRISVLALKTKGNERSYASP